MPEIEGPLSFNFVYAARIKFGDWLVIGIDPPLIEVKEGLELDATARRFLNACADLLGAKRPFDGPGLATSDGSA